MTNLQKLTAIIAEAVPEIMELKDGCLVRCYSDIVEIQSNESDPVGEYNFSDIVKIRDDNFLEYECCEYPFEDIRLGRSGEIGDFDTIYFEILGRPITLEDCLIAIDKKYLIYAVDGEGYFFRYASIDEFKRIPSLRWQLGKPLHDQSEDTINKLLEILQ